MTSKELKERTQKFALEIIKFIDSLPKTKSGDVLGKQLLRSACSVGANYRSACRAQSYSHFISKLNIVEEEADESLYWLELIKKSDISKEANINVLMKEADELTAIFTSARKTASFNKFKNKSIKS
jgi:four helix bundle protein